MRPVASIAIVVIVFSILPRVLGGRIGRRLADEGKSDKGRLNAIRHRAQQLCRPSCNLLARSLDRDNADIVIKV